MAYYKLHMPQMGESIHEATVLKWMVEEGARIVQDDIILEVATDKVDSEIPSPVTGSIVSLKVSEGEVVNVGAVIAEIETDEDPEEGLGNLNIEV
ncbi:MAG TPA: biotin/lipoyl-containing protein, partial [Membranihabitans sp.]|nr:biotin/lipoyl-containing protein [Membranihabitans sp.]